MSAMNALATWQPDARLRSTPGERFERHASAVALDDGLRVHEAEADAFALARHERIEDLVNQSRIDAGPIVAYLDERRRLVRRGRPDREPPAVDHGLGRVRDDV